MKVERICPVCSVKRQPCEICGDVKTEGHHADYSRPLDVQWLCKIHHDRIHRETRAAIHIHAN